MSNNLILLSSNALSHDDFAAFLTGIGGVLDPGGTEDARISRGRCHLWIFVSSETLEEVLEDIGVAAVEAKLGSAPRSCVVVEATSRRETDRLALDFCIAFAERWHAVIWDVERRLWTLAELRRALQNGEGMGFR